MKANEKNFIKRLQANKEDALDYIVDTYLPLIKGITAKVLSRAHQDNLLDECVNDVFLSIWDHANQFQGIDASDFKKWICTIAKFKAIDYYRKAIKQLEVTTDYIELSTSDIVEDEVIRMENRSELIQLIKELDLFDQKVFIMKYFLGYKSEEIAEQLGISKSAISNRLHRGKRKLRKQRSHFKIGDVSYEGNL